jgi:hypothetical protein
MDGRSNPGGPALRPVLDELKAFCFLMWRASAVRAAMMMRSMYDQRPSGPAGSDGQGERPGEAVARFLFKPIQAMHRLRRFREQ